MCRVFCVFVCTRLGFWSFSFCGYTRWVPRHAKTIFPSRCRIECIMENAHFCQDQVIKITQLLFVYVWVCVCVCVCVFFMIHPRCSYMLIKRFGDYDWINVHNDNDLVSKPAIEFYTRFELYLGNHKQLIIVKLIDYEW